ncbi:NBR1-Ig-like domain-containing protein [Planotetraspora sp. A-T 1434]|uniref:NBR1-Ig-like domain-containing protein n=1 Tax=Planotetraspora sp. A-T 1434 TaxID=2979219 RepID=UPI0021BF983D|nr:NBR1-Ig-like domain-containing protein [Planotetraspora sp. A-T 1434]MCT9931674.1 NBR1-Ig-like domain-containing protein [Planotetraspora sp. A-T 1434]
MPARAKTIEDFAAALRELRKSVGNPPFREMSGRSGAISHTTLHEATKGNRLPSWETTVEFVKACGADPAAYRERWERANLAVRSTSAGDPSIRADTLAARPPSGLAASATGAAEGRTVHIAIGSQAPRSAGETSASVPTPLPPPDEIAGDVQPVLPALGGRGRFRLTRPAAAALATAAVGVGTAVFIASAVNHGSETDERSLNPSGSPSKASLSAAGCPVRPTNPPWAPPAHKGDSAAFIGDITLLDCTHVGPGQTMTKVWRLKNAGTVPWKGYSLHRLDLPQQPDQCQTISDVPIKDTRPGETVDIRTDITTPRNPGLCYVRFKMMDGSGRVAFPGGRPLNFQVIVN